MRKIDEIMTYILNADKPVGSGEIARKFGLNTTGASRYLRLLVEKGSLKRVHGVTRGNSYAYVPSGALRDANRFTYKPDWSGPQPLSQEDMWQFLEVWANAPWQPKLFKSAKNLPLAIAKFFQLAVEHDRGESVDPGALAVAHESLIELRKDLIAAFEVVNRVLSTDELVNLDHLRDFLLTDQSSNLAEGFAVQLEENHGHLRDLPVESTEESKE